MSFIAFVACSSIAAVRSQAAAACPRATPPGPPRPPAGRPSLGPSLLQVQSRRGSPPGPLAGGSFEAVDGGTGRACRGADARDSTPGYFVVFQSVHSLDECKSKCRANPSCQGIEYHSHGHSRGRCEVWTRPRGVQASAPWPSATCLRYRPFEPVDGGVGRKCRGADASDNSDEHFIVSLGVVSLEACKERCINTAGCQGVEFRAYGGRCEVWTRSAGIQATVHARGYTCLRYSPATSAEAGVATTTASTTSTTKPTTTRRTFAVPVTTRGCPCMESWVMHTHKHSPCENYCCNPDGDPGGNWCFVWDEDCQGLNWGFCAGPPPTTTAPPPTSAPPQTGATQALPMEWEHFKLANQLRRQGYKCPHGNYYPPNLVDMNFDCRLWRASEGHSQDMANQNYFDHKSKDGRTPWDRARAQGISANGENIAAGCATAACALEQWKNSDPHCNNLMSADFRMFAVGVGYNADSRYEYYWTQMFTSREVIAETSCYPTSVDGFADAAALLEPELAFSSTMPEELHEPVLLQPWTTHDGGGALKASQDPAVQSPE